jgi:hypothetical protein
MNLALSRNGKATIDKTSPGRSVCEVIEHAPLLFHQFYASILGLPIRRVIRSHG